MQSITRSSTKAHRGVPKQAPEARSEHTVHPLCAPRAAGLGAVWLINIIVVCVILFGALSDRIGYKRTYVAGLVAYGLAAFPYYWLFDTREPALVVLASFGSMVVFGLLYGPLAAFITSVYSGQVRYTGSSLSYHLAAAIGGGPAPIIAGTLLATTGSSAAIAAYILLTAIVALAAATLIPDRSHLDHRIDYDMQRAVPWRLPSFLGPSRPAARRQLLPQSLVEREPGPDPGARFASLGGGGDLPHQPPRS